MLNNPLLDKEFLNLSTTDTKLLSFGAFLYKFSNIEFDLK